MADEYIVRFHYDERGIARRWDQVGKIVRCKDCRWRTEADTAWHPCTDMQTQDNWFCCDGEAKT